jgi:hypothetical protein
MKYFVINLFKTFKISLGRKFNENFVTILGFNIHLPPINLRHENFVHYTKII